MCKFTLLYIGLCEMFVCFFPLVLVAFFVAVLQEQSCCFFLLPSACLALGQLLGVSAGDFRGLQERRVWWWKEKRKKKREGSSSGSASTSVSVVHPSCPWAQRGEKGFPYSLLNSFCLVHGGRKSVESRLCLSSVYLDPGFLCCSRTVPILHDLYLA